MKGFLRRAAVACAVCVAVVSVGTGGALASSNDDDGGTQLVDVSHKLGELQKKLEDLQARGRSAKDGKLSALAECGFGETAQVFLPWGDAADYSLVPNGDFGDTSGWDLKHVAVSTDDDPFSPGTGSLLFTKGDSEAVTSVMCVNLDHPTMRLFLADRGGNGKAHLEVGVIYEDLDGHAHDLTLARLKVTDDWQPSVVIPIGVNVLATASTNGWTPVAFRFKVHGLQKGETFSLGGVYVDPCRSR